MQRCCAAGEELRDAARGFGRVPRAQKLTAAQRKKRIAAREAQADKQARPVAKRPRPDSGSQPARAAPRAAPRPDGVAEEFERQYREREAAHGDTVASPGEHK